MAFPLKDVFVLLLYLLPGFVALQFYRAEFPAKRRSDVEIIVWSVVHTVIIHTILAVFSFWFEVPWPNVFAQNSEINLAVIVTLALAGWLWGAFLILLHRMWSKIPLVSPPDPLAVWPNIARLSAVEEKWLVVRLKDGPIYLGWLSQFSFDPSQEHHDFYLTPAYLVDESLRMKRDLQHGGVYVNTRDVSAIELIPGIKTNS